MENLTKIVRNHKRVIVTIAIIIVMILAIFLFSSPASGTANSETIEDDDMETNSIDISAVETTEVIDDDPENLKGSMSNVIFLSEVDYEDYMAEAELYSDPEPTVIESAEVTKEFTSAPVTTATPTTTTAPAPVVEVKYDSSSSRLDEPAEVNQAGYVFYPDMNEDGSINYYGWDYESFNYLAMCICGEAGNCSWKHQLYVGSVVLNRVKSSAFAQTTVKGICLAPSQYSCFNKSTGLLYGGTVSEKNKAAAYDLLKNGSVLPSNVVFQAEFKQGIRVYEQIGNTYFCYIK